MHKQDSIRQVTCTWKYWLFNLLQSPPGHRFVRVVLARPHRRDGAKDAASAHVHWHRACLDVSVSDSSGTQSVARCQGEGATPRSGSQAASWGFAPRGFRRGSKRSEMLLLFCFFAFLLFFLSANHYFSALREGIYLFFLSSGLKKKRGKKKLDTT